MSQENVEVVRRILEANRSDDLEAAVQVAISLSDPSVEFTSVMAAVRPETYRGHEGIRRYFSEMAESWEEWRLETEEVFDAGPDTVVAVFGSRLIGRGSGAAVEARRAMVCVMSEGKLLRGRVHASREEALEAVSPRE
jgi:ketosteroid isomerase-like protein